MNIHQQLVTLGGIFTCHWVIPGFCTSPLNSCELPSSPQTPVPTFSPGHSLTSSPFKSSSLSSLRNQSCMCHVLPTTSTSRCLSLLPTPPPPSRHLHHLPRAKPIHRIVKTLILCFCIPNSSTTKGYHRSMTIYTEQTLNLLKTHLPQRQGTTQITNSHAFPQHICWLFKKRSCQTVFVWARMLLKGTPLGPIEGGALEEH